jgi:hypothetical protein
MRNFQKIKELTDYSNLDEPELLSEHIPAEIPNAPALMVLRMLVRPKYGQWSIPPELEFLRETIKQLSEYDQARTGIKDSWCYVTVRHGPVVSETDDEWHFDGASFRTDIIPERNYIWTNHSPTEYKTGGLKIPEDFNPIIHNLFSFAEHQLAQEPVKAVREKTWYLLSPFCLHRRPKIQDPSRSRTFIRICFTDIEGRDKNNTDNPLLPTPFFGRDPVNTFRKNLKNYY